MANWARLDTGCPNKNHDRVNLDCRTCRTIELLRTYTNVLTTLHTGGIGDGDGPNLLPAEYHQGSYRQLEQAIRQMLTDRPTQTRHMLARYRDCTHKRMTLPVEILTPRGRRKEPRELAVETWPTWVRLEKVRRGVLALSETMPSVELPMDVRERWTKAAA